MEGKLVRRRISQWLAVILLAASIIVAGPAAPKAQAAPDWINPCNLPGAGIVCEKVEKGAKWLYKNSGTESLVDNAEEIVSFATDPLGYLEQKLRSGTKGLFEAFGEELTGKKPESTKRDEE